MRKKILGGFLIMIMSMSLLGCKSTSKTPEKQKTDVLTSGPRFYRLDGDEIDVAYELGTNNKLKRIEYELSSNMVGKNRVKVLVSNNLNVETDITLKVDVIDNDEVTSKSEKVSISANSTKEVVADFTTAKLSQRISVELFDANGEVINSKYWLENGPTNLKFNKAEDFDRLQPVYSLTWSKVSKAKGYLVYAESKLIAQVDLNACNVLLEPYKAYNIEVRAILEDDSLSVASNSLYFATEDTIESQERRMQQWNADRFGMFIHWGGYAGLGGKFVGTNASGQTFTQSNPYLAQGGSNGTYSEWIKFGAQITDADYKKLVESSFTAENFSADEWIGIAKKAGMKYLIFTSKHHEGLSLFSSKSNKAWTTSDFLHQRDFVKELLEAGAKEGIRVGVYYSQAIDWSQPGGIGWTPQRSADFKNKAFLKEDVLSQGFTESVWNSSQYDLYGNANYNDMVEYNKLAVEQIEELMDLKVSVNSVEYRLDTLWWDMGNAEYPEFNYNIMKKVIAKDVDKRIIMNNRMLHHDEYTTMPFDFITPEQSVPSVPNSKYWETCMTMNDNWGYAQHDDNWKSADTLIKKLIQISSMGGNFLLNVGPNAKGEIPQQSAKLLSEVGEWMKINSEAIYGSSKSPFQSTLPWGKATQKGNKLYLHVEDWKANGELIIPGLASKPLKAYVLEGNNEYSAPLSIEENKTFKGYTLSGTPLKISKVHSSSTTVVLEFADAQIKTVANPPKLPIIQDIENPNLNINALDSNHIGDGPLKYEEGFGVSHWDDSKDYMQWLLDIKVPGKYAIKVTYATGGEGGTLLPSVVQNGHTISSTQINYLKTHPTDGWVTFKNSLTGELIVDSVGRYELILKRLEQGSAVTIKSLELILIS